MEGELRVCVSEVQKLLKAFKSLGDKKHKILHLLTLVYVSMALTKKSFVDNRQKELFDKSLVWDSLNENQNENFHHILQDMLQTLFTDNSVLCNLNEQLQFDFLSSNELIVLLATINRLLADGASSEEQIRLIVDVTINEIDKPILPDESIHLLLHLADYQQGKSIYDPKSGTGTLISTLIKHFQNAHCQDHLKNITVKDTDPLDSMISALIAELLCNGSLNFYANSSCDGSERHLPGGSFFDVILTYLEVKNGRNPLITDIFPDMPSRYIHTPASRPTLLIDHIFASLKDNGAAAVMISELSLAKSTKSELNFLIQSTTQKNFLDTVFRMPSRIFNGEPHVVIVFKKFKADQTVYFLDASMSLRSDLKFDFSEVSQVINNRETLLGRAYLAGYHEVMQSGTLIASEYLKLHSPHVSTPEEYEKIEILKTRISERSERIKKLSQSQFQ